MHERKRFGRNAKSIKQALFRLLENSPYTVVKNQANKAGKIQAKIHTQNHWQVSKQEREQLYTRVTKTGNRGRVNTQVNRFHTLGIHRSGKNTGNQFYT